MPESKSSSLCHRFCRFEISRRRSDRSSSDILSASEGISVFASSGCSQHSEPVWFHVSQRQGVQYRVLRQGERTELRPLELGKILLGAEQALDGFDVLLLREAREVVEIGERLVQDPVQWRIGQPCPASSGEVSSPPCSSSKGGAYSVSLTFLRSLRRLVTSALRTSDASDSVSVSTLWNSPRFSVAVASSLPACGGLGREALGCDMATGDALRMRQAGREAIVRGRERSSDGDRAREGVSERSVSACAEAARKWEKGKSKHEAGVCWSSRSGGGQLNLWGATSGACLHRRLCLSHPHSPVALTCRATHSYRPRIACETMRISP